MVKNKDRWSALSMKERADLIKLYVNNGITSLDAIKKDYNSFAPGGPIEVDEYGYPADITPSIIKADYPRENEVWKRADTSNADMVQRLKQGSSRATIQDWEDPRKVATHKMMSAGNYVVGNVQNINGQLFDFTDPKHGFEDPDRKAIDSAIERGDYIKFDTEGDARYFAEHYKKHYNSFGGGGHIKTDEYGYPADITPAIVTQDSEFNRFLMTLPDNQRLTPEEDYHTYLSWKLNGKPKTFQEAVDNDLMYSWDESDNRYHGHSVAYDESTDTYYGLKPLHHSTASLDYDTWYQKGIHTLPGGKQVPLEGEDRKEWEDFRKNYNLVFEGNDYKYVPRTSYNSFGDGGNTNPTTTIKPLSYVDVMLKTAQSRTKLNSTEPPEEPLPPNTKIITDSNGNEVFVRTEEPIQDVTSSIMEWAPGIGDVYELGLIGNDFNHGNYGSAALGAGLLFLPGNARKLIDKGKNLLGLNSRKAAKTATEKVKALLKRFPKGMDSPSHFSESLKERLLKEGVDPTLLTDDNLKKMTYLRSQDILESAAPSKFAARESSSGINMYNLYNTVDGNVTQVGYINAVPNPQEKSGRITMVENVTQGSRKPVKGVSELGYNTVIKDLGASENGRILLHPESTVPVLNKYEDKAIIGNYGVWYNSGSQTLGNPVYRLNTPTYDVPIKYLDDFSVEGLDDSGMFLFDFTKGPLLKNGGKLNKFDYGGNVESYNPYTDINPLMEEDSENGKYYRELMRFAVNNPETFWNDSKNSVAAREWLRKNSPADLTSLYWNTDDAFRKTIDKRFIPKEALQQETKDRYYKSMDKTSKGVALTLGASAIAPWAISGGIAAYTNPVTKSIIDLAGSIDGIRNAASKNGVRKTIRLAKEGDVWGTTKSAVGDIFDIAGGIGLAGDVYRYGKGASKRLAEAVVRIGDNAPAVSSVIEQILNKKALNYIFNPYADPNLAYNLPYTYSGVGIGEEAYKGDVVDKFFRKVPVVDSLDPDSIPSGLKSYISDVYPHKDIKYIDLGSVKPFGDYKKKVLQSLQTGESIKYGEKSGGIYKRVGLFSRPVLDPGGFNSVYKREGNDLIHEGFDIWKFNADDYMKRYSPTTEISTNKKHKLNDFIQKYKLQKLIPRLGLKFIDSMGDPVVHKFTYTYPNFYK